MIPLLYQPMDPAFYPITCDYYGPADPLNVLPTCDNTNWVAWTGTEVLFSVNNAGLHRSQKHHNYGWDHTYHFCAQCTNVNGAVWSNPFSIVDTNDCTQLVNMNLRSFLHISYVGFSNTANPNEWQLAFNIAKYKNIYSGCTYVGCTISDPSNSGFILSSDFTQTTFSTANAIAQTTVNLDCIVMHQGVPTPAAAHSVPFIITPTLDCSLYFVQQPFTGAALIWEKAAPRTGQPAAVTLIWDFATTGFSYVNILDATVCTPTSYQVVEDQAGYPTLPITQTIVDDQQVYLELNSLSRHSGYVKIEITDQYGGKWYSERYLFVICHDQMTILPRAQVSPITVYLDGVTVPEIIVTTNTIDPIYAKNNTCTYLDSYKPVLDMSASQPAHPEITGAGRWGSQYHLKSTLLPDPLITAKVITYYVYIRHRGGTVYYMTDANGNNALTLIIKCGPANIVTSAAYTALNTVEAGSSATTMATMGPFTTAFVNCDIAAVHVSSSDTSLQPISYLSITPVNPSGPVNQVYKIAPVNLAAQALYTYFVITIDSDNNIKGFQQQLDVINCNDQQVTEGAYAGGLSHLQKVDKGVLAVTKFVIPSYSSSHALCPIESISIDGIGVAAVEESPGNWIGRPANLNDDQRYFFVVVVKLRRGITFKSTTKTLEVGCVPTFNPSQIAYLEIEPNNPKNVKLEVLPPTFNKASCVLSEYRLINQMVNGVSTADAVGWDPSCVDLKCSLIQIKETRPKNLIKFDIQFLIGTTANFTQSATIQVVDCRPETTKIVAGQTGPVGFTVAISDSSNNKFSIPGFNCTYALCCKSLVVGTASKPLAPFIDSKVIPLEIINNVITFTVPVKEAMQKQFVVFAENGYGANTVTGLISVTVYNTDLNERQIEISKILQEQANLTTNNSTTTKTTSSTTSTTASTSTSTQTTSASTTTTSSPSLTPQTQTSQQQTSTLQTKDSQQEISAQQDYIRLIQRLQHLSNYAKEQKLTEVRPANSIDDETLLQLMQENQDKYQQTYEQTDEQQGTDQGGSQPTNGSDTTAQDRNSSSEGSTKTNKTTNGSKPQQNSNQAAFTFNFADSTTGKNLLRNKQDSLDSYLSQQKASIATVNEFRSLFWKQILLERLKTKWNVDEITGPDLKLRVQFVNTEGLCFVKSNQKMKIPPFSQSQQTMRRNLLGVNKLDVSRDVFLIKLFTKTDQEVDPIEYTVDIIDWTENQIIMKFDFKNPLVISQGLIRDKVYLIALHREWFVTRDTLQVLKEVDTEMEVEFPTQLKKGDTEEQLVEQTNPVVNGLRSILIIELITQLLFKTTLEDFWTLLYTLQVICYLKIYDVRFPANADFAISFLTRMIEFEILNVNGVGKIFVGDDFDVKDLVMEKKGYVVDSQLTDMTNYVVILIQIGIIFVLMGLSYFIFRKYKEQIKAKIIEARDNFFWNGFIRGNLLAYLKYCLTAAYSVEESIKQASMDWEQIIMTVAFGFLCLMPLVSYFVLRYNIHRLHETEVRARFLNLYGGIKVIKKNPHQVYYQPLFMLRRVVFVLIPTFLFTLPFLQIQALLMFTTFYVMYYMGAKPHYCRYRTAAEMFNECSLILINYHMVTFTDFTIQPEARYHMGISLMITVGVVVLFNVSNVVYKKLRDFLRYRRMWGKNKMQMKLRGITDYQSFQNYQFRETVKLFRQLEDDDLFLDFKLVQARREELKRLQSLQRKEHLVQEVVQLPVFTARRRAVIKRRAFRNYEEMIKNSQKRRSLLKMLTRTSFENMDLSRQDTLSSPIKVRKYNQSELSFLGASENQMQGRDFTTIMSPDGLVNDTQRSMSEEESPKKKYGQVNIQDKLIKRVINLKRNQINDPQDQLSKEEANEGASPYESNISVGSKKKAIKFHRVAILSQQPQSLYQPQYTENRNDMQE